MSGDDDGRERPSWREIDRMRDSARAREERRPRSEAAKARAGAATRQYLKQIDGMFSSDRGAEGGDLARAIREAHGTPALPGACRAYLEAHGAPRELSLLSLFLDAGDPEIVLAGLGGLHALVDAGAPELSRGQRTQLRILAQDANDDIAEAAEELLELL